ncbi:MAG TPA: ATP-binding protein [Balneolaceae bacterium]|nr:ATP-binding protein [Balneolaceae bacterium]
MYPEMPGTTVPSDMDYLDVKNLARTGEGTYLEFKRTIPSAAKIAREMAAFANTNGGTLLIGVDDDQSLVGVDGYQEEEFLLKKAANEWCNPPVTIRNELVQFGKRDLLVVKIPEAPNKPIFVKHESGSVVYIRDHDQNLTASVERIHILENKKAGKEVTFQYGPDEQKLFRYLNEYSKISVKKFSHLIGTSEREAGQVLVDLTTAGILNLFTKDNIDYFSFAPSCKS